nr:hypothetical protein [Tanacetum cinerariifolium]
MGGRASRGGGRTRGRSSGDQGNSRNDGLGGQVAQVDQGRGQRACRNQKDDVVNDHIQGDVRNATEGSDRRGCTYKNFLACNPKEYDGKGYAIVYTRWIEKMEPVHDMSGCRDSQRVKYTAGSFVGKSLTWWNFEIHTRGREAAVGMSWEDFRTLTKEGFCLSNEMQKNGGSNRTKTIQKAVRLANTLTDVALRNRSVKKNPEKRENRGEPSNDRNGRNDNKRTRTRNAFSTIANPIRGGYTGTEPKCTTCSYHHPPETPCRSCFNCNRFGHFAKDCRVVPRNVNTTNAKNPISKSCFKCGSTDHTQLTPPYTPQHNGVSEKRNRTLLDMFYFPPENKIVVARHAEFFEKNLITQEVSGRAVDLEEIQDEDTSPSEITSEMPMEVEGFEPPQEEVIPIRRSERTQFNKWIDAMNMEIQSMIDNIVWVLVDLPPGCKTVGSKWIFKKKTDMDGIVHTYKACLVAGFVDPNHSRKVCKLQRSIYGLKQASRSWNKRFDEEIKRIGFAKTLDNACVYQKASGSNVTFLILYVDDIIIVGNHILSLQSVKYYLGKCFTMKYLGEAAFILGIKIYRDRSKRLIKLGQNAYIDKILKRYKMDNSKRGHIPMQERLDLNRTQGASTPKEVKRMQNVPYASVVGSIMYAVRCTRTDVAFAQNITSRFQQNPGKLHWTAVKNILKYLRNTKDIFLVYGRNPEAELRVDRYCDVGFETDREAEYIVASEAAMKAVWIRKFISGLRGARHYHKRYHYVRESIALGEIKFLKVHIDDNLVDPFTKALSNTKLTQHASSMGLCLASSFV